MEWTQPTYKQFVEDMTAAGLNLVEHKGRKFFFGPAVVVDNVTDVITKTKVDCTWYETGSQWVVHPRTEDAVKS